jgi:hypothetical protein
MQALHGWLDQGRRRRQILFIAGEAGLGKDGWLNAFWPKQPSRTPWIGQGQCMEHRGVGEAYMPVLDALGRLCRGPDGQTFVALLDRLAPTWLVQMPWLTSRRSKHLTFSPRRQTEVEILQQRTAGLLVSECCAKWPIYRNGHGRNAL